MRHVDMYLLPNQFDSTESIAFVCRLLEKIYLRKISCYVAAPSDAFAKRLDEALWCLRADSFVPHQLVDDKAKPIAPIIIGLSKQSLPRALLVNLDTQLVAHWHDYTRIADIVGHDEHHIVQARARYKIYRQQEYQLKTHDLRKAAPNERERTE